MARAKRYWLLKCEPAAYAIEDLERDGVTTWEGVRNFQARNFLRDDLKVGDGVLFYASNADPSGVTGLAEVARAGYPDPTAFNPKMPLKSRQIPKIIEKTCLLRSLAVAVNVVDTCSRLFAIVHG